MDEKIRNKEKREEEKRRRLESREEEKRRKQEEKAKQKAEKALNTKKQKAEKELISKKRLTHNPEHSIKLMQIIMDEDIQNFDFYIELLKDTKINDIKCRVQSQLVSKSITWNRTVEDYYIDKSYDVCSTLKTIDENHILVVWDCEETVKHLSNDTFISTISDITLLVPDKRVTLVIYKIENYFKSTRNTKTQQEKSTDLENKKVKKSKTKDDKNYSHLPKISRKKFEQCLVRIQIMNHVNSRLIENEMEMNLLINQFTKSIALLPSKLEKKEESYKFEWYIGYDNKDSVKVDKDGYGLKKLWQQQLCQFPLLSLEIAEAITSVYKSPLQLIKAYENCNQAEGAILLRDIPIRRAAGPLTTVRKIGPELSKKIYIMFTSENGDTPISE